MRIAQERVKVHVPATSANLGPGFDVAGLALALHDELELTAVAGSGVEIDVSGEGSGEVPTDESHLVVRAIRRTLDVAGAPQIGIHLRCRNVIPHGRGLGSSAAATVAGIVLARGLLDNPEALSLTQMLEIATEFEGHPDNAAPALIGGVTLAWEAQGVKLTQLKQLPGVKIPATVLVPQHRLATATARGLLPTELPFKDVVFQASRAALLTQALTAQPELLFDATEDLLHQKWRSSAMPESLELIRVLRSEGIPAVVSGAGPTVLLFADPSPQIRDLVREVVADPGTWNIASPGIDLRGALGRVQVS